MNLKYLTESYIPEKILFRDEQLKLIQTPLDFYKKNHGKGPCLLITGRSGSGKTSTIKYLIEKDPLFFRYATGAHQNKSIDILKTLSKTNYHNRIDIKNYFIKDLNREPKCLVIDEPHLIKDYIDLINDINLIYRETQVPIILLTNNIKFIKSLPEDVEKTLFPRTIMFPLYDVPELHGILKDRLKLGQIEIPEDKQTIISAVAGKQGSARLVLDISYICIENNNFENDFILSRVKQYNDDEIKEMVINNLNATERTALDELLYLKEKNKDKITSRDLFQRLNVSKSTISNILNHFELKLGIIETTEQNLGRKIGRIRLINMDEDTYKILKGIDLFEKKNWQKQ